VTVTVNVDTEPMLLEIESNPSSLQIDATSSAFDATRALRAGESDTINLEITIPESRGSADRYFYVAKVRLLNTEGLVGVLPISVEIPVPKVNFGNLIDPATGERAPVRTVVGSGGEIVREFTINSNVDLNEYEMRSNFSAQVRFENVPGIVPAREPRRIRMVFTAPMVNRTSRANLVFRPTNGLEAISPLLRMRITILPIQIKWDLPLIRRSLVLQDQSAERVTVTMTSNYDVNDVQFGTIYQGLTPILSPLDPVNLRANVPQNVVINVCPGYARTQYFLGITAYQGSRPLNRRLQIRVLVNDDGSGEIPINAPPCQTQG